jgi:hypothetical protein
MNQPKIVLVDFGGTSLNSHDLHRCAVALQMQVNTEFALPPPVGWGLGVQYVRVASQPHDVRPDEYVCGFMATADVPGALGYHDRTPHGLPFMKCFPLLDAQDGQPWQPTASHELLETLLDPELSLCFQAPDGTIWAGEVADAVEADTYYLGGVPLSNWCTPSWFQPPADLSGIKFDWMGLCSEPFEVRQGGYAQQWDGAQWNQVESQDKAMRAYRSRPHNGRRDQRRGKVKK